MVIKMTEKIRKKVKMKYIMTVNRSTTSLELMITFKVIAAFLINTVSILESWEMSYIIRIMRAIKLFWEP